MHAPHFNIIFLIIRIVYMTSYHVDSYSCMYDKPIQVLCPASCRKAFFALGNISAFHENYENMHDEHCRYVPKLCDTWSNYVITLFLMW